MLNKDQFADNHFIRTIIEDDLKSGKHTAIQTRFPPEPNGYLHIGHAKSICLNFGLAYVYDGLCNLRFDDTNPEKENQEYVDSIKEDVNWLGFEWAGEPHYASDYFDRLFDYAVGLIKDGKAYVDDLTAEEMREYRGTLTEPGKNSPYRERSVEENLDLFMRMKNGEFPDGSKTLRLKIDMASGNVNMRDPVIYRIRRAYHHNTGDKWCIYPMYDYTHAISDAIEGITHSLCTLEFEAHRPLYDWVVDNIIVTNDKTRFAINVLSCILSNLQSKYIQLDLGNNINKHIEIYNEISNMRIMIPLQLKNLNLESKLNVNILQKLVDISLRSYEGGSLDEEWTRIAELISDYSNLIKEIMSLLSPFPTRPRQYEFSRLELLYSITSKRKLNQLVADGHVSGWDDPRMPTISGMRRRGYTPEGLRLFAKRAGISKSENVIDMSVLEGAIREELENSAPRMIAVLNPLKVTLTNFDPAQAQSRYAPYHPNHEEMGGRELPISSTLYIEADDFAENPPKGFKRLTPGGEVRLRHSYVMRCDEVVKDSDGHVVELKCSLDYDTLGKNPEGRKVKGVIHWLSAEHAVPAAVRLYERLFTEPRPDAVRGEDGEYLPFTDFLNPESVKEITAYAEPAAKNLPAESRWQFERLGYFVTDRKDHRPEQPVFNRTVTLKDSWQPK